MPKAKQDHVIFGLVAPHLQPRVLRAIATSRRLSTRTRNNAQHGIDTWRGAAALAKEAAKDFCLVHIQLLDLMERPPAGNQTVRIGNWRISRGGVYGGWHARWSDPREFPSFRIVANAAGEKSVRLAIGAGHGDPMFRRVYEAMVDAIRTRCGIRVWRRFGEQ